MLTFEQIKELIDLVSERDLQGVEVERSGFRVKIEGRPAPTVDTSTDGKVPASIDGAPVSTTPAAPAGGTAPAVAETPAEASPEEAADLEGLHLLRSPIVGTFYTSPSPDADPYIRVGDRVKRGQVLCIVEAMKLMNEIESDEDGVIEKVFPKNAQPVEYGEPLFAVRQE